MRSRVEGGQREIAASARGARGKRRERRGAQCGASNVLANDLGRRNLQQVAGLAGQRALDHNGALLRIHHQHLRQRGRRRRWGGRRPPHAGGQAGGTRCRQASGQPGCCAQGRGIAGHCCTRELGQAAQTLARNRGPRVAAPMPRWRLPAQKTGGGQRAALQAAGAHSQPPLPCPPLISTPTRHQQ